MLEKALADTDPQTTDVIVMTAKMEPPGGSDTSAKKSIWTPTIGN